MENGQELKKYWESEIFRGELNEYALATFDVVLRLVQEAGPEALSYP